jgi:cytochrome c oxidase assembly factor 5
MASSCSKLKEELISCLQESQCVAEKGHSIKDCLSKEHDSLVSEDCRLIQRTFFDCKRSMVRWVPCYHPVQLYLKWSVLITSSTWGKDFGDTIVKLSVTHSCNLRNFNSVLVNQGNLKLTPYQASLLWAVSLLHCTCFYYLVFPTLHFL